MQAFGNIVVFHPAAIGDAMLASPIATTLKLNYPAAKLTYWTHPALKNILLELCPSIDEVIDYDRDLGIFQLAKNFNKRGADLFVDLANSFKSQAMTWMTKSTVLRYQKQAADIEPRQHAVGNFMETIRPVCQEIPEQLFPSIFPAALSEQLLARIFSDQNFPALPLIGLVPGVGKLRPHRAWLFEGWLYLLRHILENGNYLPVLIGGEDEIELSEKLNQELDNSCMNACGQLSLTETAALLKACKVVIAGDTGPAHMAVAVGTPVIGLYGPTYPERSGPYGYQNYVLSQSADCDCHALKICRYANPNEPGRCMQRIMLAEVLEKWAVFGL
jgi:ADP-heptose:LPS heptosyltransferase